MDIDSLNDIDRDDLEDAARQRRNAYQRAYYARNKERAKKQKLDYWVRQELQEREAKAEQLEAEALESMRERGVISG